MDVDAFVMRKADEFLNVATKDSTPGEAGAESCGVSGRASPYFDAEEAENRASKFREALLPSDKNSPLKQYLNMLGSYEGGAGCGVNWIDLFYRSFDQATIPGRDQHSNYHSLLDARGRDQVPENVRTKLKEAWNAYEANPDRTFVTATVFEKIASERNDTGPDTEAGGSTKPSFRTGAAFTNLDIPIANECIGMGPKIFKVDDTTYRLNDDDRYSLGIRAGQNVAFGALTKVYESAFDTKQFVYLYIPHSVRAHNVHVGTAVGLGLWGSRGQDELKTLINRVVALAGIWARQLAEFDTERKVIAATRRSLMASLMTRNISHNIGSHVLASDQLRRARQHLGSSVLPDHGPDQARPDDVAVFGGFWEGNDPKAEAAVSMMEKLSRTRQLASERFDSYLQNRMDFVALAVGAESGRTHPVPMRFHADILEPYMNNHLLLGSLLRDQNYTTLGSEISSKVKRLNITYASGEGRDPYVAIPGASAGRHAFYTILENIARNAAKYGAKRGKEDLTLEITIRDNSPGTWLVSISENLSDPNDKIGANGDAQKLTEYLNCLLKSDHVVRVPGGEWGLTNEGRGLQEMKACAEFLRGEPSSSKQPLTVSASKGKLSFEFNLLRPCFMRTRSFVGAEIFKDASDLKELVVSGLRDFSSDAPCEIVAIAYDPDSDEAHTAAFLNALECALAELQYLLPARQVCIVNCADQALSAARRIAVVQDRALYSSLFVKKAPIVVSDCSEQLLAIYSQWLLRFCPPRIKGAMEWNLLLYFDRPERPQYCVLNGAPSVRVHAIGNNDRCPADIHFDAAFANHGRWPMNGEASCRIKFGNADSLALHAALSDPPSDRCQCTWLVLNLMESALARVGVFDERLDEAIAGNNDLGNELEDARIYQVSEKIIKNAPSAPLYDLLLVHLGRIEQIIAGASANSEDTLRDTFKKLAHRTVLVTGRGGNRGRFTELPVIEYSLVRGSLMMGIDKRLLVTAALTACAPQDISTTGRI
jgi:hypothetical protein